MTANKQTSVEAALEATVVAAGLPPFAWRYVDARTVADMRLRRELRELREAGQR